MNRRALTSVAVLLSLATLTFTASLWAQAEPAQPGDVELLAGWNLLAVDEPTTATELAGATGVTSIHRWDAAAIRFESWQDGLPSVANSLQLVQPYEPVWVFAPTPGRWPGVAPAPSRVLTVVSGWNTVFWSGPETAAGEVLSQLGASALFAWDATTQTFRQYVDGAPEVIQTLTVVESGRALWVLASRSTTTTIPLSTTIPASNIDCSYLGIGAPPSVTAPPEELDLDPFYEKYIDACGLSVVSSAAVDDRALQVAAAIVNKMLSDAPDVAAEMRRNKILVAVMDEFEVTTDIPDHADLNTAFPGTDWDARARGLGATLARPTSSAAEEMLMCVPVARDGFAGENILVHEFSHSMFGTGLAFTDRGPEVAIALEIAFSRAVAGNVIQNTYAATNSAEYWAEGVQSWFNTNLEAIPTDGIHNAVNTRAELRQADPELSDLLATLFADDDWEVPCGSDL